MKFENLPVSTAERHVRSEAGLLKRPQRSEPSRWTSTDTSVRGDVVGLLEEVSWRPGVFFYKGNQGLDSVVCHCAVFEILSSKPLYCCLHSAPVVNIIQPHYSSASSSEDRCLT